MTEKISKKENIETVYNNLSESSSAEKSKWGYRLVSINGGKKGCKFDDLIKKLKDEIKTGRGQNDNLLKKAKILAGLNKNSGWFSDIGGRKQRKLDKIIEDLGGFSESSLRQCQKDYERLTARSMVEVSSEGDITKCQESLKDGEYLIAQFYGTKAGSRDNPIQYREQLFITKNEIHRIDFDANNGFKLYPSKKKGHPVDDNPDKVQTFHSLEALMKTLNVKNRKSKI